MNEGPALVLANVPRKVGWLGTSVIVGRHWGPINGCHFLRDRQGPEQLPVFSKPRASVASLEIFNNPVSKSARGFLS